MTTMPKFSRTNKQRQAFLKSLARSLILNGKIVTTRTRAKATKQMVDKLITKGKVANVATIRSISALIGSDSAQKLLKEISPSFAERHGGYTRMINLPARKSDASQMAVVEIIK